MSGFKSISITSLRTAEAWLIVRRTVMFVQEHAIPLAQQVGWIKRAAAKGYSLILTPTDPEAAQPRGGGSQYWHRECTNQLRCRRPRPPLRRLGPWAGP